MADRIQTLSRDPLVVAGDLNVCPTDLDVYDPAAFVGDTHVTEAERERFRDLHPDDPGFTWWDTAPVISTASWGCGSTSS